MSTIEIIGLGLLIASLSLAAVSMFIPRPRILQIGKDSVPPAMTGRFAYLKVIHNIPFWMLNTPGKLLRITIDVSALTGLLLLCVDLWIA